MQGSLSVSPSPDTQQDTAAPATFAAGAPADEAGGILTIDLAAIEANWKILRSASTPAECAAVVKADGYGLGLEPVAQRLVESRLHNLLCRRSLRRQTAAQGRA